MAILPLVSGRKARDVLYCPQSLPAWQQNACSPNGEGRRIRKTEPVSDSALTGSFVMGMRVRIGCPTAAPGELLWWSSDVSEHGWTNLLWKNKDGDRHATCRRHKS